MLKKTITYEDFNDEEVTEDLYFHLTEAEIVELQFSQKGGLKEALERMIRTQDGGTIMTEMRKMIMKSYGKRSDDGARFIKNDQVREEFESSQAYSKLFMELVTDAVAAAEFINGVVPKELAERAAQLTAQRDEQIRQVRKLKLQGHSNADIAEQMEIHELDVRDLLRARSEENEPEDETEQPTGILAGSADGIKEVKEDKGEVAG